MENRISMWDRKNESEHKALKEKAFLEKGFELFAERGIEGVTLKDVACEHNCK